MEQHGSPERSIYHVQRRGGGDGKIAAHCEKERKNRQIPENQQDIDGKERVDLPADQFEEIDECRFVDDRLLVFADAGTVFIEIPEQVEREVEKARKEERGREFR